MILPPFLGISSNYDEDQIKEAIISYLSLDTATFDLASNFLSVTFLSCDTSTFDLPHDTASVTYVNADVATHSDPSNAVSLSYLPMDVCTYDPPPEVPFQTCFTSESIDDSLVSLTWGIPGDRRSPILNYVLEYTDCFLSTILTEDNDLLADERVSYDISTENNDNIKSESGDQIVVEFSYLITDNYRTACHYNQYDYRRVLIEDHNRLLTNDSFFVTEKSSGIGLSTEISVDYLDNGQAYLFRVAAVNAVGTGEYCYSNLLTPVGLPGHVYCDIRYFLQPNSPTDIFTSLRDYSCREKDTVYMGGVTVNSDSKFGPASLAFDGLYESLPSPGTYSHLQVNNNSGTTGEDWSLVGDFNIEMWMKPDSATAVNQYLLSAHNQTLMTDEELDDDSYGDDPATYIPTYWHLYRNGQDIKFQTYAITGYYEEEGNEGVFYAGLKLDTIQTTGNVTLSTTDFNHIAVSRFDGMIKIFVNGIEGARGYVPWDVSVSGDFMVVGAKQERFYQRSDLYNNGRGETFNPFKGKIDDILFVNKALYSRSFTPVKYDKPADCDGCGGYSGAALSVSVSNEFIP